MEGYYAITSLTRNRPYRKSLLRVFNLEFKQAPLKQRQALLESNLPRDRWRRSHPRRWSGKAGFDSRPCPLPCSCRLVGLSLLVGLGWGRSVCAAGRPPAGLPSHASKNSGGSGGQRPPSWRLRPTSRRCSASSTAVLDTPIKSTSSCFINDLRVERPKCLRINNLQVESVSACSFNDLQA